MTCAKMLPPPWQILAMSPFQVAQLHWGPLISLATDQTLVRAFGQDNRHEWVVSASRSQVSQQFHGRLGRALAGHVPIGEGSAGRFGARDADRKVAIGNVISGSVYGPRTHTHRGTRGRSGGRD